MKVVPHEGYVSFDGTGDNGWGRAFCVQMPNGACGLLIAEHVTRPRNDIFDIDSEMNLAIVCAGSLEDAMTIANGEDPECPHNPTILRRLARLMSHGSLVESFKDTLSERGMLRLVVHGEKMTHASYSIFDRAGFRKETRGTVECRVLDL